jgi:hypothetical protein
MGCGALICGRRRDLFRRVRLLSLSSWEAILQQAEAQKCKEGNKLQWLPKKQSSKVVLGL